MTNLEYIQQLGKEKGLEYIMPICPFHPCHDCDFNHNGDLCEACTAGADAAVKWLFKEHRDEESKEEGK